VGDELQGNGTMLPNRIPPTVANAATDAQLAPIQTGGSKTLAAVSGILASLAVGVIAVPAIPFPWGLIAGGLLGVTSIVMAAMAGSKIDTAAIQQITDAVVKQLENNKKGS